MVPWQPCLTSPPLGVVGGRGAPEALPSLLPPLPPTPGRAATICGYSFTRQKKKSLQNVPHRKKKMRNREKKTCEWAWRMGLLKLRRSRGSPSHSASLWERSRARPARPPAPWTSEQVGARRPRPRPPPPPSSSEIRFPSSSPPPEPHAGARPGSTARAGEVRPGALERGRVGTRHSWSPLGGAGRWPRARRGAWTTPPTWTGGHLEPQRGGVPENPGTQSPAPESGRATPRRAARVRGWGGGDGTRREGGGGQERKREGGRQRGSPRPSSGRRGGGRHLGPRRTPSSAGGEGRRARERREGRASLAGPGGRPGRGTPGGYAARGVAGALHAAHRPGAGGR